MHQRFPAPSPRADLTTPEPNKSHQHLAFAAGLHQCAGMSLARLKGAVAT